jgi:hypothetical protein
MVLQVGLMWLGRMPLPPYIGNLLFWVLLFVGQPLLVTLYVRAYSSCIY